MDTTPQWSRATRWLHLLIALGITTQLILSLILVPPDELDGASEIGKIAMEGHEIVGLVTASLLLLHWIWLFMRSSDLKFQNLFPWFSAAGLQQIKSDIQFLISHKTLPKARDHGGLSGFVHGLGILVASSLALTGVGLYIVIDFTQQGADNPLFENIAEVHELLASLMWTYLVAHVLAAAWHEYSGERIIPAIFRL